MKMDRDEMLEYLKRFNGKYFNKENKEGLKATVKKMEDLLKKFGFEYHRSFNAMQNLSNREDTSWFWRFKIGEYEYIEVQTGWINKESKTYGRGKNAKRYLTGYEGLLRVHHNKVSLNPETGRPWQIGDTVTHESGCYSVTLTKRGWYSGD